MPEKQQQQQQQQVAQAHIPIVVASMKLLDLGNFRSVNNEDGAKRSQPLSWRLTENLSDWTLEINKTDVYHVHKSFLAAGKRSSVYFERLFQSGLSETVDSMSHIELESSAAHAVPAMLDFMYYHDDEVKATTYTAVALRYLSNYFSLEEMFDSVNRFIQCDFSTTTAITYLQEAFCYNDLKILDAAAEHCAQHFEELDEDTEFKSLHPLLLHKIVTHPLFSGDSLKLSRVVAHSCRQSHADLDAKVLEQMTDFVRMPTVDPQVALSLLQSAMSMQVATLKNRTVKAAAEQWLELAALIIMKESAATSITSNNFLLSSSSSSSFGASSCNNNGSNIATCNNASSLSSNNNTLSAASSSNTIYSNLSDAVKVKVLEKSLIQARHDYSFLEDEKKDLKKELRDKTRDLKRRQRMEEDVAKEQEERYLKLQQQLTDKSQMALQEQTLIIARLKQELVELQAASSQLSSSSSNNNNNTTSTSTSTTTRPTLRSKDSFHNNNTSGRRRSQSKSKGGASTVEQQQQQQGEK